MMNVEEAIPAAKAFDKRLPCLDLLRIIAALAVMAFHWGGGHVGAFPYGYLGVELFFMISGFVIAASARNRTRFQFVKARARRLWPTFVLCLALTLCVAPQDPVTVLGNLTMIPHLLQVPFVDGVYWSLQVEIGFYAAFALLVIPNLQRLPAFSWSWLSIVLLAHWLQWDLVGFAVMEPYAPFFVTGIGVYLVCSRGASSDWILWALATLASMIWAFPSQWNPWVCVAIVATSAVLMLIAPKIRLARPLASVSYVLGGISYPLYLIHSQFGTHLPFHPAIAAAVVFAFSALIWWIDGSILKRKKSEATSGPLVTDLSR